MKRSINFLTLALPLGLLFQLSLFLTGCSDQSQDPKITPSFSNGNIMQPGDQVWTARFQLPPDWKNLSDHGGLAYHDVQQGLSEKLAVYYLGSSKQLASLQKLRDQAYDKVFCTDQSPQNFINCQKGFSKSTVSIAGFSAEVVHYYGTWQDDQQEVHEIFLNQNGKIIHLSTEGNWQEILLVMQKILPTLHWSLEKPSTQIDLSPELKGL